MVATLKNPRGTDILNVNSGNGGEFLVGGHGIFFNAVTNPDREPLASFHLGKDFQVDLDASSAEKLASAIMAIIAAHPELHFGEIHGISHDDHFDDGKRTPRAHAHDILKAKGLIE